MNELERKKLKMELAQLSAGLEAQEYRELQLMEEINRLKDAQEAGKKAIALKLEELNK